MTEKKIIKRHFLPTLETHPRSFFPQIYGYGKGPFVLDRFPKIEGLKNEPRRAGGVKQ